MKKALFIFAVIAVLMFNFTYGLEIKEVELNGKVVREASDNYIRQFERDNYVDVKVEVESGFDADNSQIEVEIQGLEHDADLAFDETEVFDMKAGVRYVKDLRLLISKRMQNDKVYRLRVRLEDRSSEGDYKDYMLYVDSETRVVEIKDVILSPEYEVVTGQALLVQTLIHNYGQRDEEDVFVNAKISELGVSGSTVVSEISEDASVLTEPIFIKLPDCAKPGVYSVDVLVKYDKGDELVTQSVPVNVVASETCNSIANKESKTQSEFVAKYQDTEYKNVVVQEESYDLSKVLLQYSLMGLALLIILIVIFVIVKQARKEAMDDEEFLKELEEQQK